MPDPKISPVHRAGVRFEELDGEAVIYDRTGQKAIYLNATATVIWKLCDGQRTLADISSLLSGEFPDASAEINADISEAVERMAEARVLVLVESAKNKSDTAS